MYLLCGLNVALWFLIRSEDSSCSRPLFSLVEQHALRTDCLLNQILLLLSKREIPTPYSRVSRLEGTSPEKIWPNSKAWLSTPTLLIKLVINRETKLTEFVLVLETWGQYLDRLSKHSKVESNWVHQLIRKVLNVNEGLSQHLPLIFLFN